MRHLGAPTAREHRQHGAVAPARAAIRPPTQDVIRPYGLYDRRSPNSCSTPRPWADGPPGISAWHTAARRLPSPPPTRLRYSCCRAAHKSRRVRLQAAPALPRAHARAHARRLEQAGPRTLAPPWKRKRAEARAPQQCHVAVPDVPIVGVLGGDRPGERAARYKVYQA